MDRCADTIDLEELIEMKRKIRVIAEYNSGRKEEFTTETKADGKLKKKDEQRVDALRALTTVKRVRITESMRDV